MNDATTFFLSFATVFAGIALLLLHLERRAKALERRLATLEAATTAATATAATAKPKGAAPDDRPAP